MTAHRVLVESQQQVQLVAVVAEFLIAHADREENVSAANDGLIGVVGVQVETAPDKHPGEDVAWRGDSLSGCSANRQCKIEVPSTHECS